MCGNCSKRQNGLGKNTSGSSYWKMWKCKATLGRKERLGLRTTLLPWNLRNGALYHRAHSSLSDNVTVTKMSSDRTQRKNQLWPGGSNVLCIRLVGTKNKLHCGIGVLDVGDKLNDSLKSWEWRTQQSPLPYHRRPKS